MERFFAELLQDEKPEPKKDGDVEMKGEEAPSRNPTDGPAKTPEDTKPKRKSEPSSEHIANFSRVTPMQLAYISFPSEGRYQPVRPVSLNTVPSRSGGKGNMNLGVRKGPSSVALERYVGGGGILMMVDERPDEEAEFITFEPPATAPTTESEQSLPNGNANRAVAPTNIHIALDESSPDVDPPESFEVRSH